MSFSIHTNHRLVFLIPAVLYLVLVAAVAVLPAVQAQRAERGLERREESDLVKRGREVYQAFNCVSCHTQQIRGDEYKAREIDGERIVPVLEADARFDREVPSRAHEYAHERPVFMGTQRTGPDLSAVGRRLPDAQWHYWHLYDPRSVSPDSVMPPHRFLFTTQEPQGDRKQEYEEVVNIEGLGLPPDTRLWARPDARALVEYLLSLTREFLDEEDLAR